MVVATTATTAVEDHVVALPEVLVVDHAAGPQVVAEDQGAQEMDLRVHQAKKEENAIVGEEIVLKEEEMRKD